MGLRRPLAMTEGSAALLALSALGDPTGSESW
jgi:hypothetical protein